MSANESIRTMVASVSHRIQQRRMIDWGAIGLAIGSFAALIMACVHAAGVSIHWGWMLTAIGVATLIAAVIGRVIPASFTRSARLIDSFYMLKDRTLTALQFEHDSDPVRQLQVKDAVQHLRQVRVDDCVPFAANRPALMSAATMGILSMAVVLSASYNQTDLVVARPVNLAALQAAELRQTMLEEIQELAKDVDQPELEELIEKLDELVDELETESMDPRDMMATLSEMEQVVAEAREAMQLDRTDAQLKSIAEAIESSEQMKAAAKAMEQGDYDQAAEKLEAIDPNQMSDKERRATADNLKKFLAKLKPGQKGQLSGAAQQLQQGLENKDLAECKSGMCKLAGLCKKQGSRKKIGECMACQLNRLSLCKGQCRGQCENPGNSIAESKKPSQKWGQGAAGLNKDAAATKIDSVRQESQLTGVQGDGPSESEVLEAPEGDQDAARQYVTKYQKFRSEAEAVLESEPLPLGHRETIRQYFENIRPENDDSDNETRDATIKSDS